MIVLLATDKQRQTLEGIYKNACELRFVKDGNGNWVVGINVIHDENFAAIHDELSELPQIEYVEPHIENL